MKLNNVIPKETLEKAGELALRQLDTTGYHLAQWGLTDKVNRHNCIALIITEDQRLRGELSRLQLIVGIQKGKIKKARRTLSGWIGNAAEWSPAPLNKSLIHIQKRLQA